MKFLVEAFSGFFYKLNTLTGSFGLSLVIFTFVMKLIFSPIDWYLFVQEKKIKVINQKLKNIFTSLKNNSQQQIEAISSLYRELNYNPFLYFLFQMIQIPIFLAIFFVLKQLTPLFKEELFLGISLSKPSVLLSVATILLQLISLQQVPKEQRKFTYLFIGLIAVVILTFPASFTLYWLTNILLTLLERQIFVFYEKKFASQPVNKE